MKPIFYFYGFLLCLGGSHSSSDHFRRFVAEVRDPVDQSLLHLKTLITEVDAYDDSQPLSEDGDQYTNIPIQRAINNTYLSLNRANEIANRHLLTYESLTSSSVSSIGNLQREKEDYEKQLEGHRQAEARLRADIDSLTSEVNRYTALLEDARRQHEDYERSLRRRRRNRWGWIIGSFVAPPLAIGLWANEKDIRNTKDRIHYAENLLNSHRASRSNVESQLHHVVNLKNQREQDIRRVQSQLDQTVQTLNQQRNEQQVVIGFGVQMKRSATFLEEFRGKAAVLHHNNGIFFLFESTVISLRDMIDFLNQHMELQIPVLTTQEVAEQLRRLIQKRTNP